MFMTLKNKHRGGFDQQHQLEPILIETKMRAEWGVLVPFSVINLILIFSGLFSQFLNLDVLRIGSKSCCCSSTLQSVC